MVPSALADVPGVLLDELARARRGVVVLAVDGLSHGAAVAAGWQGAELRTLASTFPSVSATAWLTAVTGVGPRRHGVPGAVYRVPGQGTLVDAITGRVLASGPADPDGDTRPVLPHPTVFDRAGERGYACRAVAREIGWLSSPWARALLHGTTAVEARAPQELAAQAADPAQLAAAVAEDVESALTTERALIWVYVNLDDHVHGHGYDAAAVDAMHRLGERAAAWAERGWTVVSHADHGQVPCRADAGLAEAFSLVDDPEECYLPSGGAGRVRWLYPKPGRAEVVRERLAVALGDCATVRTTDPADALRGRVGTVVAVAADARFPVPVPGLHFEHGGCDPDEATVPLAVWRSRPPARGGSPPGTASTPAPPR
jgi:hypothetical protein